MSNAIIMDIFIKSIIFLYFTFNTVRVFSYVPQIVAVAKELTDAKAISLITWSFWSMANLTTGLYANFVANDMLLAWMSYGNTLGCVIVVGIVIYKRKKYGNVKFFNLWNKICFSYPSRSYGAWRSNCTFSITHER